MFVCVYGFICTFTGILAYRIFRHERKKKLKLVHAGIMLGAFLFTVIALKAVFDSHNLAEDPIPNLYSLHSWIGIITVVLFTMQVSTDKTGIIAIGV